MTEKLGPQRHLIYTVVTGGYDVINRVRWRPVNVDFVAFVDNSYRRHVPPPWTVVQITQENNPRDHNRRLKMVPGFAVEQYETVTYIDGNLQIIGSLDCYFEAILRENKAFGVFQHFQRRNPFEEIDECVGRGKMSAGQGAFEIDRISKRVANPGSLQLFDGSISIRNVANPGSRRFGLRWSELYGECPGRDQISLSLVVQENAQEVKVFDHWRNQQRPAIIRVPHRRGSSLLVWLVFEVGKRFPTLLVTSQQVWQSFNTRRRKRELENERPSAG